MKKIKINKGSIRLISLIVASIFLLLLLFWLGFSYFSMRSDRPYVSMLIDFEDNELAKKVVNGLPRRDGKFLNYDFMIILEEFAQTEEGHTITGVPYNYSYYYESRDAARFSFDLDKDKGRYDFTNLTWNEPLLVTLSYRVDRDFRFFLDFSSCTIQRAYANLFNIGNSCGRGNCIVERDLISWNIELIDKDVADKMTYLQSFNKDELTRGLFNYYITNDFGYFDSKSYKISTTESSLPDGTYQLGSDFVNKRVVGAEIGSTVQWVLGTVSEIIDKEYEEYEEIDLHSYMETIGSYSNILVSQTFKDCQIAYETIDNLKDCKTNSCDNIKEISYQNCKNFLNFETSDYDKKIENYYDYDTESSRTTYLLYLPSEMIYFNKIVDILEKNDKKYDSTEIYSYYTNSQDLLEKYPTVASKCHLLKVTEDLKAQYKDSKLTDKVKELYSALPEFTTLCDNIIKDKYCSQSIAEKLVCADATLSSYPETARTILYDIFYRHYYLSPASLKLSTYEAYRVAELFNKNVNNLPVLYEHGYFVSRIEVIDNEEVTVHSTTNLLDSYYFIYILSKLSYE